jgi:arylsulfatase A-like enzyme
MKRPNILPLYTDQQRWDALGASNPDIRTSCLGRPAAEGVKSHHRLVQSPARMPSRASFPTG